MMVRITNEKCIEHLLASPATNTEVVETALCRAYGIPARRYNRKRRGRPKSGRGTVAVKIADERIRRMLRQAKSSYGASHHFSVEKAILDSIPKGRKEGGNA